MKPTAAVAEVLEYLRDLGFVDFRVGPTGESGGELQPPKSALPRTTWEAAPATDSPVSALDQVAAEAAGCRRCRLCETRDKVVFGSGPANARLMFIGEGPGAEENRQGMPFVGAAGDLLTRIVQSIGLHRDQVYIANIVKCRPPGNRDPASDEIAACRDYLEQQIGLVRPSVIVALGRVAAQTLLGSQSPLGRMRGEWYAIRGIPLRVTYHPAALLRDPALKRPTWEDMQLVRDRLGELAASGPVQLTDPEKGER